MEEEPEADNDFQREADWGEKDVSIERKSQSYHWWKNWKGTSRFFLTNLIPETTLSAFDEREAGPQKSEWDEIWNLPDY